MPENRQYAGPHDAAELMVDDGRYALVVRHDLSDEVAARAGYIFDGDEAVRTGKSLAVRSITVSDELAAKLDRATFTDEAGEQRPSWPRIGGTPAAQTVDVPESNPSTKPVKLDDGTELTAAEADERAYDAAEVEEVLERAEAVAEAQSGVVRPDQGAQQHLAQIEDRLAEIDKTVERATDPDDAEAELDDSEVEALENDRKRLIDERVEIEKALEARS